MQEKVRFYADYRIKQHAPLRLLRTRLFFLISLLQVYSQGGMVKAFASKRYNYRNDHSSFTVEDTRVPNSLFCLHPRTSTWIYIGRLPSPLVFHLESKYVDTTLNIIPSYY